MQALASSKPIMLLETPLKFLAAPWIVFTLECVDNNAYMWPGLRKQGMWAQSTPCLFKGHISVLEQNMFVLQPAS